MKKIKDFIIDYFKTIRSLPSILLMTFVLVIVVMNLLASKTIYQNEFIAIDGGIILTWMAASICDIVTVARGPKTTIKMSIFGLLVNLLVSLIFYLVSIIPSNSGSFNAFSEILGGTWFIIISSAVAFIVSTTTNALINYGVGLTFKKNPDGKIAFGLRCYVSTVISQFIDNLVFSTLAYVVFAPKYWGWSWNMTQVLCCAALYAGIALVIEIIMTPLSYRICRKMKYID